MLLLTCSCSYKFIPSVESKFNSSYSSFGLKQNTVAMDLPRIADTLNHVWLAFGILMPFLILFLDIKAPYGKFTTNSKLNLNGKISWIVAESLSLFFFLAIVFFACSASKLKATQWILCAAYSWHYIYRSFIYTWRLPSMSPISMPIFLSMILFNSINGFINGFAVVGRTGDSHATFDASFYIGLAFLVIGWYINFDSDNRLMALRRSKKSITVHGKYFVPEGGFFQWVSCANYFGEIVEWFGWALATWSLGGLGFAVITTGNLVPRALSTHLFYLKEFGDRYPSERNAVIPFLI